MSVAPKALLGLTVLLAGCATAAHLDAPLGALVGKPVQAAIDRLGPPTGVSAASGERTYVWTIDKTETVAYAKPPDRYGVEFAIATSEGGGQSVQSTTYDVRCWIRLDVDAADVITAYAWSKDTNGCAGYATRLGTW